MMNIYDGLEWLKSTVGSNVDKIENELKILEEFVGVDIEFDYDDVMVDELEEYSYLKLYHNRLDNVYLELRVYEEENMDDGLWFVNNHYANQITSYYVLEILVENVTQVKQLEQENEQLQQKNEYLQEELDSLKNEHFELLRDFYSKHKQEQVSTEQPKRTRPRFR